MTPEGHQDLKLVKLRVLIFTDRCFYMKNVFIFFISILFLCSANAEMKHNHKVYNAVKPYPAIKLKLEKDMVDGFNLTIKVNNFTFAPERVNQKNDANEGHAHIYINDRKIRQYSPYFHIPNNLLRNGENKIRVSLHANDHSHFVVNMEKIQATLVIK